MRAICLVVSVVLPFLLRAQEAPLYRERSDGLGYRLTPEGASRLASLPLRCIGQEFPNKTNHTSYSDSDHVLLPRQLHPAFYGCFDWHSAVHGHWMLVRLLKQFPSMPEAERIRVALRGTLTENNIRQEVRYFDIPLTRSWERTYGWAWLLKLDAELYGWDDPDARAWYRALQPLTSKVLELWTAFLPKQTYPNRTGVHPNTAFGMVLAIDQARRVGNKDFESKLVQSAEQLFGRDGRAPVQWEPNGSDFLSPSLEEADLMRRVLSPAAFRSWLARFMTLKDLQHLSRLPQVSDRTDLQIVHLDGLCFSRSWCMQGIAAALPASDPRRSALLRSAHAHLAAAIPHVLSGEYGGEHWLASFAVYALLE